MKQNANYISKIKNIELDEIVKYIQGKNIFIILDKNVSTLYSNQLYTLCQHVNTVGIIDDLNGELDKSLSKVSAILNKMLALNLDRKCVIFAIGGGVTTDISGLVASLFKRGVKWVAVPTTLLAMVDAAIGGKTGINTEYGKNTIGTFYDPENILYCPAFLSTLPQREWISGLGECLKYAFISNLIRPEALYTSLEDLKLKIVDYLYDFAHYKVSIVSSDHKEKGIRKILNFGHTFGHSIEKHMGYGRLSHGEAVMYGIAIALFISSHECDLSINYLDQYWMWLKSQTWYKQNILDDKYAILEGALYDKKNTDGVVNMILLKAVGSPLLKSLEREQLGRYIDLFIQEYILC